MTSTNGKQKIVVLGGGVAAMTAVFEITSQKDWQKKYDITVYQMGWRLGGKGASGRRMTEHQRIEEHGLHIWFGFYENAFNMMYRCYNELQRSPNAPLHDVYSAFEGQDDYIFMEHVGEEWIPWKITVPSDNDFPGIPLDPAKPDSVPEIPSIWDYIQLALNAANQLFTDTIMPEIDTKTGNESTLEKPTWWQRVEDAIIGELKLIGHDLEVGLLERALEFLKYLDKDALAFEENHQALVWLLKEFKKWLNGVMDNISNKSTPIRRAWILIDIAVTGAIGMIQDQIFSKGFDVINNLDFREWLTKYEISQTALNSGFIRSLYDIVFGYINGDESQPSVEAGSMLRSCLRLAFTYRGHILYKMRAGMGDTIFAPLYQVLKARGVTFKFFHKVTQITPNTDNTKIDSITIGRQADLTVGDYNPLYLVKGLPCWPSNPIYEQLVQGEELREKNINLESRWADWENVGEITLKADKDFDHVILGISLAALPFICDEKMFDNEKWGLMRDNLQSVQTQASQVWFKPDAKSLDWDVPGGLIASFREPLASWADLSELIPRENWIPDSTNGLFYTTGVMNDGGKPIPPPTDHAYPDKVTQEVKDRARKTLQDDAQILFPNAVDENGNFRWDLLAADDNQSGEDRFNSQYWRANVDPTERYVLTVKDTSQYRLSADNSEFENLTITGTWIQNPLNLSCVEAAAMAGMLASRAITGEPQHIVGENDIPQ